MALIITTLTILTGEQNERLEDKLRDFFEENGIDANIDNTATGNNTKTRMRRSEALGNIKAKEIIIPVMLQDYTGTDTFLEVTPDCMWIAVHLIEGAAAHDLTDYGYRTLEELKEAYKEEEILE